MKTSLRKRQAPASSSFSRASRALAGPLAIGLSLGGCNLFSGVGDLEGAGGASAAGGDASQAGGGGAPATGSSNGGSGAGSSSCSPPCGANQTCDGAASQCVCAPGFVDQGGACIALAPGDPAGHTQAEVCDRWAKGHVITEQDPVIASGADCDAGTLKQAAIVDTLVRMNMFRWLSGLGPTSNDPALDANAQKCANLEAWWDFNNPQSPHQPPSNAKCYTAEGAATAGESNIAWGSGHPAQAIDQYMEDNGNASTMGHRRWILNPPLGPVGVGYWKTGGQFGDGQCLRVFGSSGEGPSPSWVALPNQGYVPVEIADWPWTFHGSLGGIPTAKISVVRVDDGKALPVNVQELQQGYAQDAISWIPSGWQAEAGKTYRVTVSGLSGGDVVYDVKPITCN